MLKKKKIKQTKVQKIELLKLRIGSLQNEIKILAKKRETTLRELDLKISQIQARLNNTKLEFLELTPELIPKDV